VTTSAELLTVKEAAALLRRSTRTVRTMILDGRLRAYQPGRGILIPRVAVEELLAKSIVDGGK